MRKRKQDRINILTHKEKETTSEKQLSKHIGPSVLLKFFTFFSARLSYVLMTTKYSRHITQSEYNEREVNNFGTKQMTHWKMARIRATAWSLIFLFLFTSSQIPVPISLNSYQPMK